MLVNEHTHSPRFLRAARLEARRHAVRTLATIASSIVSTSLSRRRVAIEPTLSKVPRTRASERPIAHRVSKLLEPGRIDRLSAIEPTDRLIQSGACCLRGVSPTHKELSDAFGGNGLRLRLG